MRHSLGFLWCGSLFLGCATALYALDSAHSVADGDVEQVALQDGVQSDSATGARVLLEEFEAVLAQREALRAKEADAVRSIQLARATAGEGARGFHTPTGQAYRQAVLDVEKGLDAHPEIAALQAQHDVLQERVLEISNERAAILTGWRAARDAERARFNASMQAQMQAAWEEQRALLEAARARSPAQLPEASKARYREIQSALTNTLAEARAEFVVSISAEGQRARRVEDGTSERFERLNEEHASIQAQQKALQEQMQVQRDRLRKQDAGIAALQQDALAASREHLQAMEMRPEVVKARAWLGEYPAKMQDLTTQAYALYVRIIHLAPDLQDDLLALAREGNLVISERTLQMAKDLKE